MLYARAVVQGARWYCSSVFMGNIYIPEELDATTVDVSEVEDIPLMQSNSEQISNLLNELGVTEPADRKAVAMQHLNGRKAADLMPDELEHVLTAIRDAYAPQGESAAAATVVVDDDDDDTEAVQFPQSTAPPARVDDANEDEPTDARAAISTALDSAGITDVDERQRMVKRQLMAMRRRKVETLTPEELLSVIEGITATAA